MHRLWDARDALLINTVGHSAGLLLFAALIALLLTDWRRSGIRQTGLTLTAATLAFFWNFGSLLVLAWSHAPGPTLDVLVTFSFSILSIIPAVLLSVVFRGTKRWIVAAGYTLSGAAIVFHLYEVIVEDGSFHEWGLYTIAIGYAILLATAIAMVFKSETAAPSLRGHIISLVCLLCFSLTFLHFGNHHPAAAWTAEVAWHHASIPLVLFVLLQDYRFLLLDVFFQFVINFGLAALFVIVGFLASERFHLWAAFSQDQFWLGIGVVFLCLYVIVFAYGRRALQDWLTALLFRRTNFEIYAQVLRRILASAENEKQMLQVAAHEVAAMMGVRQSVVQELRGAPERSEPFVAETDSLTSFGSQPPWTQVVIPVRLFQSDSYYILLGSREGSRRYLSQDLDTLRRLAAIVVEEVERFRHQSLERLVVQAELRALQSQINPHFLFNALNTLYGTIDRTSQQARQMVLNLTELFRYALRSDRQFIRLEEELRIVRAYLDIEKLRLGDRLNVQWDVSDEAAGVSIPVLSIQPLVENAVKHGVAAKKEPGLVRLRVTAAADRVAIRIEDTGPGFSHTYANGMGVGVGLENVRQRLLLCYGNASEFTIHSDEDGSAVSFFIPVTAPVAFREAPNSPEIGIASN